MVITRQRTAPTSGPTLQQRLLVVGVVMSWMATTTISYAWQMPPYRPRHGSKARIKSSLTGNSAFLSAALVGSLSANSELASDEQDPAPPRPAAESTKRHSDNPKKPRVKHSSPRSVSSSTTATPYSQEELTRQIRNLRRDDAVTPSRCDALLASCVAADAWDTVLDVLDLMKEHGWKQTHATYTASLQACAAVGNAASAYEIWQAMGQAAVSPNGTDVGLLLSTLCGRARFESKWYTTALEILDNLEDATLLDGMPVKALDAVLREIAFRKEWRRALRLLQTILDRRAVQPSHSTFRWTVEACLRAGQHEQAAQILSSSLALVKASTDDTSLLYADTTRGLFAQAISGLAKKRQWRKALQLLDLLEQQDGVKPTLAMYNAIMVALGKAKELSQAKRLMRRLKANDLFPDILTYNSLMAAAAHRWREALTVLDECHREPGVEPDVFTYTSAIRACAKGGKITRALTLLRVVQDKELPLDAYVYTAAMEACAKGKLSERALELLQEMQHKGIDPTEVTYSVAITACGNAGEWERSLELLDTMRSKGLSPNLITYNGAIAAIARAAKHGPKDHRKADGNGSERWDHVKKLLNQMKEDGLEPDGFSYSSAISCCGSEGRWEEALELMDRMRRGGPATRPNKIAYTAAISSCGKNGKDKHALKLFNQMKEEGLEADRVAYNALFSALRVSRRPDVALELWDEMLSVQTNPTSLTRKRAVAARSDNTVAPDIITVTDAIGALSVDHSQEGRANVDRVLRQAVERGILLRNNKLDSFWEVDLSGLSLPVARAATRHVLRQILALVTEEEQVQDLTLITGIGVGKERSTTLREYIREILRGDFNPPLTSIIPQRAQGTVLVEKSAIVAWLGRQQQNAAA